MLKEKLLMNKYKTGKGYFFHSGNCLEFCQSINEVAKKCNHAEINIIADCNDDSLSTYNLKNIKTNNESFTFSNLLNCHIMSDCLDVDNNSEDFIALGFGSYVILESNCINIISYNENDSITITKIY